MNHTLGEKAKMDNGFGPLSIAAVLSTPYFDMSQYGKAAFVVETGVMAAGVTAVCAVWESDGVTPQALDIGTAAVPAPVTCTITANTLASVVNLNIVSAAGGVHVAGQTVTINGLVFTAAAADVPTTRTYAVGATGAASAAALLAKINSTNANIGVPGVTATLAVVGADEVIALQATDPGERAITAVASAATTVVSTVRSIAVLEVDASYLTNGYSTLACRVTPSAACITNVGVIRSAGRYTPVQALAASFVTEPQ